MGFRNQRFGTTYLTNFEVQENQETNSFFGFFTFEDMIDVLSQNVGKQLTLYAA